MFTMDAGAPKDDGVLSNAVLGYRICFKALYDILGCVVKFRLKFNLFDNFLENLSL